MTQEQFEQSITGKGPYGLGACRLVVSQGVNADDDGHSIDLGVVRFEIRHLPQSLVSVVKVRFRGSGLQEITDLQKLLIEEDKSVQEDGFVPTEDKALLFQFSTLSEKVGDGMLIAVAPLCWSLAADYPEQAASAFLLVFDNNACSFIEPAEPEDPEDEEEDGSVTLIEPADAETDAVSMF